MTDDRTRGWALAAIGMLLVSTDSYFIRRADFDSWTIAFVFGVASTITLGTVFLTCSPEPARAAIRQVPGPLAAVVALSAATQIAFTAAVNHTSVANVVVIVGSTPVFAATFAWWSLRERTEPRVIGAIALALTGIVVVVQGSVGAPTLDGDLLALLAIVLVSASLVIWRRHPEIDRPLALALASATMALVAAPFASLSDAPTRVFVAAGVMGLLFNPLGRISYTTAPRYAPTSEVALFTPVETVAATAWAWIFFSERPTTQTVVGGMIVIAAIVWGTIGTRPTSPTPPLDRRQSSALRSPPAAPGPSCDRRRAGAASLVHARRPDSCGIVEPRPAVPTSRKETRRVHMADTREWTFDGSETQIAARSWGTADSAARYVAVLVHGYGEHIGRYDHVAEALVDHGAVVYGLDHLGHGQSGGERVLVSDFAPVVADVDRVVTTARNAWPDRPVVMIGHSMGGLIAARYAQMHGDRLTALVLSGPAIGDFELLGQLLALDEMPDVPLDPAVLSRDSAVGDAYAADPLVWHGPFKRPTVAAMANAIDEISRSGSVGELPVLWIHGADDQLVPIEGSRTGVEALRGERFRKHEYDGARHEVFNETNRDEVIGDVTRFVDDVLGGAI